KVGEFRHSETKESHGALYRHKKTGKYHHEDEHGDPDIEGHDTPEKATKSFRKLASHFNQREGDMKAEDAHRWASGLYLKKSEWADELETIDSLEKGEGFFYSPFHAKQHAREEKMEKAEDVEART